jgi:hypothetical protein
MIYPITNYFPTHHNRLFRETNSWTIGLAQDAEIPDLMKFWQSGLTGPTIFVNSVIVKKANFQNIFYYFSIL